MRLTLSTYDGTSISGYNAKITGLKPPVARATPLFNERSENTVSFSGKSFQPTEFEIECVLRTSAANRNTDMEALGKLFDPRMKRTLKTLVALDAADSDTPYYIECTPVDFPKIILGAFFIRMWSADPVWKKVTATTDSVSITGGGTTNDTITNNGNVDCYPSIALTPTASGGLYTYRRHVIVYNPVTRPLSNYPVDITGGGADFTTLAKSTAKSNQINVGAGINASVDTWAIDTAVGGGLPSGGGYFMMESEQCSYTSISGGTTIIGVTRGINGTTAATHADNVVMYQSLIQANGDDIRTFIGATETERWFGGTLYSDTTAKIWNVYDFPAGGNGVLRTTLASSGETAIVFRDNATNRRFLERLPDTGMVYIDTEAIGYTAKSMSNLRLTIANSTRGIKDTTAAGHTAGVSVYYIPYDIIIAYSNLTVDAPVQTDIRKPCFSLENSSNTNWRYDSADSVFTDLAGLRSGGWKPSKPRGVYSNWYTGDQGTFGTDPATNMGAEIVSYQSGSIYKSEAATILWTFQNNAGITSISSIGESYKSHSATPFPACRLQSSVDGVEWTAEWSESAPASAATWDSWTHASETVQTGARHLRFLFAGAVQNREGSAARNEVNLGSAGSTGVSFTSANVPQVTLIAQGNNAFVDFTLTNSTTGEAFSYSVPLLINNTITFDTEARTVTYLGVLMAPPELNSVRQEWFRLQPGSNSISYADSNGGAATMVFTYKERKNV